MDLEPTSFKQAIQQMMPKEVEILLGKVISAAPLQIQLIHDDKIILSSHVLCVPSHLSTYKSTVDLSGGKVKAQTKSGQGEHSHEGLGGGDGEHSHSLQSFQLTKAVLTLDNSLKTGEVVYLLSTYHGKKYYILDREAI